MTTKIPVIDEDTTQIIEVVQDPRASPASNQKPAVKVAVKKNGVKIKPPLPVPNVRKAGIWTPRKASPVKSLFNIAASIVCIIAVIVLGYLRFIKGIDVFKPVRNRLALAYCALVGEQRNYTLVDKKELNDLIVAAEKPTVVTQEYYTIQADGSVTKSKDTGTRGGGISGDSDENEEDGAASSSVQTGRMIEKDVKQEASSVQNVSVPVEFSSSATEAQVKDKRLDTSMKGVQKEDPAACLKLADHYYNSVDERAQAFEWYQRAAKYGTPQALLRYGDCLMAGLGTEKNELKAVEAYKKAAEKNNIEAKYRMGECCLNGTGVVIDKRTAFSWFFQAAVAGYEPAIEKVAECYEIGIGVNQDTSMAKQWRAKLQK